MLFTGGRLREHQLVGLKTILRWYNDKHGGIVADEMGLGKTCQAIGTIVCLLNLNSSGRHLVICPLSVMEHWQNELSRFMSFFKFRFHLQLDSSTRG